MPNVLDSVPVEYQDQKIQQFNTFLSAAAPALSGTTGRER
jgi:hypothetical protein